MSSSSGYYEYSNNKKTVFTEEKIKEEIDNIILNDIENEIMEEIKRRNA